MSSGEGLASVSWTLHTGPRRCASPAPCAVRTVFYFARSRHLIAVATSPGSGSLVASSPTPHTPSAMPALTPTTTGASGGPAHSAAVVPPRRTATREGDRHPWKLGRIAHSYLKTGANEW